MMKRLNLLVENSLHSILRFLMDHLEFEFDTDYRFIPSLFIYFLSDLHYSILILVLSWNLPKKSNKILNLVEMTIV